MAGNTIEGNLRVKAVNGIGGDITLDAGKNIYPLRARSSLAQEPLVVYPVELGLLKIWNSGQPLTATANTDDLAYVVGTWATNVPVISAGDVKNTSGTRYALFTVTVPAEYDVGETLTLRFSAATMTTVASASVTLDAVVYLSGRNSLVDGSDLCATAAQSINSTSFADKDFTITQSGLVAGDVLVVRVDITWVDSATGTAVTPTIGAIELLADIKG